MSRFSNDKISQGLNFQYAEKTANQKKTQYKNINNKTVNAADFNGSESFLKMQKGLSKAEKKSDVKEVSFYEEHTLNRKYIDTIFNSPNVQETVLLINSMQKRVQELNGYMLSGLKAKREQAEQELRDIQFVFDKYAEKIDYLVENGVLQSGERRGTRFRFYRNRGGHVRNY